ncbi:MAG: bifunctional precorrin-2 dehydrogenase/sirohydrochlorin ferrochelatase [Candidatus Electrothrix sp. AU1_5]|nr:bifunctional precorrin-2 dehydrogenase/sirohydrochlorin ferrochelatase [Candidatus Electrothrix gigas]
MGPPFSAVGGKRVCYFCLKKGSKKPGSGERNSSDPFNAPLKAPCTVYAVCAVYPVSLNISGKLCVVVGGGNVAERKVLSLLNAHAAVRIISPQLTAVLAEQVAKRKGTGTVMWQKRGYQKGDLQDALLVFAATDNRQVQDVVVQDAQQIGVLVNVADAPEHCDFQVPAVVQRGDLQLAVSTHGTSPALAAKIRQELDDQYGEEYAVLLRLMSVLRKKICNDALFACVDRKRVFQNILHEDILHWIRGEQWQRLAQHLDTVLGSDIHFDLSEISAQYHSTISNASVQEIRNQ